MFELTDELDLDPSLFFIPLMRPFLRGHSSKVLQITNQLSRRRTSFSVLIANFWNKPPISIFTATSINAFLIQLDPTWISFFSKETCELPLDLPPNFVIHFSTFPFTLCTFMRNSTYAIILWSYIDGIPSRLNFQPPCYWSLGMTIFAIIRKIGARHLDRTGWMILPARAHHFLWGNNSTGLPCVKPTNMACGRW